jgi:Fur family ferric uptake transcriptional regulator
MRDLLGHKSIRITDFRIKVLEVFEKSANAISIKTIEKQLGNFDRITLYRTLKTFIDKGLVHEVQLPNEEKMLALCSANCDVNGHKHEHIHFKCNKCKEVFCKKAEIAPNISIKGFLIEKVEISTIGTCENCLKNN